MKDLIFVKLGGSVITDKSRPYTVRENILKRLCEEISSARKEKGFPLIVGHGGGSFPHVSANKYQTHKGIINEKSWEGFGRVQEDASRLNRIVVACLIESGLNAVSIQPSASCIAENERIVEWYTKPIETFLSNGIVPVPYGDACLDTRKGCCIISTEEIFNFLSRKIRPRKIVLVGKVDGVLDAQGNVIPKISSSNLEKFRESVESSDGVDVTGGMLHKVERSLESGIETVIINGNEKDRLRDALTGRSVIGTILTP